MPPDAPQPVIHETKSRFSRRKLVGLLLMTALIGSAGLFSWLILQSSKSDAGGSSAFQAKEPAKKPAVGYCSLAGTALVCQDIKTGDAKKYALPSFVGTASRIVPSPDEKHYFVETPTNPLPVKKDPKEILAAAVAIDRVYVVDSKFQVVKELTTEKGASYSGIDWAADSKSLVYAEQNTASQKSNLYVYEISSGKKRSLASDADIATLFVTADGKQVVTSDSQSAKDSKLGLQAIGFEDGKSQPIETKDLAAGMQYYANYTYDRVRDRLYITGSNDKGPMLVIAKPVGGSSYSLTVQKTLQDGQAYTPLVAVDAGMFVHRQKDSTVVYGVIGEDGGFTPSAIKPGQQARFGLHGQPALTAGTTAEPVAEDYVYSYLPDVQPAVKKFLAEQAAAECDQQARRFNTVSLMANDADKQLAVHFSSCNGTSNNRYYVAENNTYRKVLEATGAPDCSDAERLGLSKTVVPYCEGEIVN